jgi:hypothetical protein
MNCFRILATVASLALLMSCSDDSEDGSPTDPEHDHDEDAGREEDAGTEDPLAASTVLEFGDVKANPTDYEFGDFRPNVRKLILAGTAETEHVAVLWYQVPDAGVGLHYHSKTESVYVIDGTQTDGKGVYPTATVYFNPPGSGHQITDASGFFLLAYASPPDFAGTAQIGEYEPIRIATDAEDLTSAYPFEEQSKGVKTYALPTHDMGGMTARFIELASSKSYDYRGNYLLVAKGRCVIGKTTLTEDMVVVSKTVEPQSYGVTAAKNSTCLVMGVSF